MPTNNTFQSGGVDLNWGTIGNWDLGHVPIATETAIMPTGLTAAINVVRIPAVTGSLAGITCQGTGGITLSLSGLGSDMTIDLGTGDLQAGTAVALLLTGSSTTNRLTFIGNLKAGSSGSSNALQAEANVNLTVTGNIYGGTGTAGLAYGAYADTAKLVLVTGDIHGGSGSGTACHGYLVGTGGVTVTGNVYGGSVGSNWGIRSHGGGLVTVKGGTVVQAGSATDCTAIYLDSAATATIGDGSTTYNLTGGTTAGTSFAIQNASSGVVTLNQCNLEDKSNGLAYSGIPPAWVNTGPYDWKHFAGVAGATALYFAAEPVATDLKTGVVCGRITGSLAGGGFTVNGIACK
jgi:hypothetical protein